MDSEEAAGAVAAEAAARVVAMEAVHGAQGGFWFGLCAPASRSCRSSARLKEHLARVGASSGAVAARCVSAEPACAGTVSGAWPSWEQRSSTCVVDG